MTTLYTSDFDTTPAADETTATTAAHTSAGAGIGVARITIGATAAVKWDSDTPHTGTRSLRIDGGNPAAFTIVNPTEAGADLNDVYFRGYSRFKARPAANATFICIQNNTPTLVAGVQMLTTGELRIRNGTTTQDTTTRQFNAMEWFGWEWHLNAVADTMEFKVYDDTYSNVIQTLSGAFTGIIRRTQIGNITGWSNSETVWYDDLIVSDSAYPGPLGTQRPVWNYKNRATGLWTPAPNVKRGSAGTFV